MKKRSLLAIFTAVTLLSGCSSGEGAADGVLSSAASGDSSSADTSGSVSSGAASTVGDTETASAASTAGAASTSSASGDSEASSAPATTAAAASDSASSAAESASASGTDGTSGTKSTSTADRSDKDAGSDEKSTISDSADKSSDVSSTDSADGSGEYTGRDIGGRGDDADYDIAYADEAFADVAIAGGADGFDGDFMPDPGEGGDMIIIDDPIYDDPIYDDPGYYPEATAGLLTGGEWNDNEHWDFWKGLYDSPNYSVDWTEYAMLWKFTADRRLSVTVEDSNGQPVSGARVSFDDSVSVTDKNGMAYFFFPHDVTNAEYPVTAEYDGHSQTEQVLLNGGDAELTVKLDSAVDNQRTKSLDLMIMCDTTGSMSDELNYLKCELEDVVTRIKQDNANIPTRISVNFYRDEGDEYIVREFPFTSDLNLAVGAIAEQYADGGGDYPEAVHKALESAVNDHDWAEDSVKVMFLVLDAPPHDDVQIIDEVVKYTKAAAEKGIRIIPVAASGVDKSTEFLLRSMALTTNGTYVFLTNDSGIGGSHIEPTIGSYDVEKLNDMMVRIVGEYIQ